jgi:hypothetical protein
MEPRMNADKNLGAPSARDSAHPRSSLLICVYLRVVSLEWWKLEGGVIS